MTWALLCLAGLASAAPRVASAAPRVGAAAPRVGAAAAPAVQRAASDDAAFSVELLPRWTQVRGHGGRTLELRAPESNRLLIVAEWRDGAAPAPAPELQARVVGAETAALRREGAVPARYARRPHRKLSHLQGWLPCGGDRYLFDGQADRDETLWRFIDSFQCARRQAGSGMDIGRTGWRVTLPSGFVLESGFTSAWVRARQTRSWTEAHGRDSKGQPRLPMHRQHLRVATGSEIWSPGRPWPEACGKGADAVASQTEEVRLGKTALFYRCSDFKPGIVSRLVYLLIHDYDGALGQAYFIQITFTEDEEWERRELDEAFFRGFLDTLEREPGSREEKAPKPDSDGAIPLLR